MPYSYFMVAHLVAKYLYKSVQLYITKAGAHLIGMQKNEIFVPAAGEIIHSYKLPRSACSLSIASNKALKFPLPKLLAPFRWMISKNNVGRSCTGLVNIWSK